MADYTGDADAVKARLPLSLRLPLPLPLPLRLPLPLCATCMRALILAWLRLESAPCLRGSWLSYLGRGGGGSERVVANRTW